jgi:hypothetical protein
LADYAVKPEFAQSPSRRRPRSLSFSVKADTIRTGSVIRSLGGEYAMRLTLIAGTLTLAALALPPAGGGAQTASGEHPIKTAAAAPPVQSGIYGFSGGKSPLSTDPEGVIGECIWIFDAANKRQVAKGECSEKEPGKFRVVLNPGRYVVHGPGGNQHIEIKPGGWVKVTSIALLPVGP